MGKQYYWKRRGSCSSSSSSKSSWSSESRGEDHSAARSPSPNLTNPSPTPTEEEALLQGNPPDNVPRSELSQSPTHYPDPVDKNELLVTRDISSACREEPPTPSRMSSSDLEPSRHEERLAEELYPVSAHRNPLRVVREVSPVREGQPPTCASPFPPHGRTTSAGQFQMSGPRQERSPVRWDLSPERAEEEECIVLWPSREGTNPSNSQETRRDSPPRDPPRQPQHPGSGGGPGFHRSGRQWIPEAEWRKLTKRQKYQRKRANPVRAACPAPPAPAPAAQSVISPWLPSHQPYPQEYKVAMTLSQTLQVLQPPYTLWLPEPLRPLEPLISVTGLKFQRRDLFLQSALTCIEQVCTELVEARRNGNEAAQTRLHDDVLRLYRLLEEHGSNFTHLLSKLKQRLEQADLFHSVENFFESYQGPNKSSEDRYVGAPLFQTRNGNLRFISHGEGCRSGSSCGFP